MDSTFYGQLNHFRGSLEVRAAQLDRIETALVESAFAADERMRILDEQFDRMFAAIDAAQARIGGAK